MPFDLYLDKPEFITDVLPDEADSAAIIMCTYFDTWLDQMDLEPVDMWESFYLDYNHGITRYTRSALVDVARSTARKNSKKYDMLIAAYLAEYDPIENYRRVEESTHTREPDITKERTPDLTNELTLDTTQSTTLNQTKTTTDTPPTRVEAETQVSPYDTNAYKAERKTITTQTGTAQTEESYAGDPDTVTNSGTNTTTITGTETETETGTDTTTIESTIAGNIGVKTTQSMLEEQLQIADKMKILKIMIDDLAAAVLIGVW